MSTDKKLQLFERVIYACVTIGTGIIDVTIYGPSLSKRCLECSDSDVLIWSGNVIASLISLIEPFDQLLLSDQKPQEKRHVLFDANFPSRLLKNLLEDFEVERCDYNCSLMHLILQVTLLYTEMILRDDERIIKPQRSEQRQALAKHKASYIEVIKQAFEKGVRRQLFSYMEAERVGFVT